MWSPKLERRTFSISIGITIEMFIQPSIPLLTPKERMLLVPIKHQKRIELKKVNDVASGQRRL